jgi:hypothetical protein
MDLLVYVLPKCKRSLAIVWDYILKIQQQNFYKVVILSTSKSCHSKKLATKYINIKKAFRVSSKDLGWTSTYKGTPWYHYLILQNLSHLKHNKGRQVQI